MNNTLIENLENQIKAVSEAQKKIASKYCDSKHNLNLRAELEAAKHTLEALWELFKKAEGGK